MSSDETSDEPLFRFGLIADVQYADDEPKVARDWYYRASPGKLDAALADLETQDLAFAVHLGDLVDHDLSNVPVVLDRMTASSIDFRQVLGNHDFRSRNKEAPINDLQAVCEAFGLEEPYYAFDLQGWRFLVLNTSDVGVIASAPGSAAEQEGRDLLNRIAAEGRPNANPWNGTIGQEQRDWLAQQLTDAHDHGLSAVILAHHSVYPDHHDNLLDDRELREWLAGFPALVAWFNGHQHEGGYGSYRGVHYVTLAGMLQTPDRNAYAVASVHPDRIEITGYDREPSRTLEIIQAR